MDGANPSCVNGLQVEQIAECLRARLIGSGQQVGREISGFYAGDRISDLIERASPGTLLVTNISNSQLIRVAELMDVPGICIAGGVQPPAELAAAAARTATAIIVSPEGLFETCGRLYALLHGAEGSPSC